MTNLNNITDFFRPNRLIWQETKGYGSSNIDADSDVDVYADTEEKPEEETPEEETEGMTLAELKNSVEEGVKVTEFYNKAQQAKDIAARRGVKNIYERICSLKNGDDTSKIINFRRFIDELGEKILNVDPEYKDEKDTMRRLRIIEKMCDMNKLMDSFEKSVSYEIRPYRNTNEREAIKFTYEDGSTEVFPLELSAQEINNLFLPHFRAVLKGHDEYVKEQEEREREIEAEEVNELVENAGHMDTPDKAWEKLMEVTSAMSPDLLDRICEPLSAMADIFANSEAIREGRALPLDEGEDFNKAMYELKNTLIDDFGEDYRAEMDEQELKDLDTITRIFQLEGFI
jgi:hypothetical protein